MLEIQNNNQIANLRQTTTIANIGCNRSRNSVWLFRPYGFLTPNEFIKYLTFQAFDVEYT